MDRKTDLRALGTLRIVCALGVRRGTFWRCGAGEPLLLRTGPWPRGVGPVRVSVRVAFGQGQGRRLALKPAEVDEEGLVLVRLPRDLAPALLSVRLCVGGLAGPAALITVSR